MTKLYPYLNRRGHVFYVHRCQSNPNCWVATTAAGVLVDGVDAQSKRDALGQLRRLDGMRVL